MSALEHMVCAPCYQRLRPGIQPHRLVDDVYRDVRHTCCCCGQITANIPYREEPPAMACGGVRGLHEIYG